MCPITTTLVDMTLQTHTEGFCESSSSCYTAQAEEIGSGSYAGFLAICYTPARMPSSGNHLPLYQPQLCRGTELIE